MNKLKMTSNAHQKNQTKFKTLQLNTIPNVLNNNAFNENDEYCYELDQSSYSDVSYSNKSQQNNNSNTIQMISELSDLDINNKNEPLKYINHIKVKNKSIDKNKNQKKYIINKGNNKNNFDLNNNIENNYNNKYNDNNTLNNSSSYNYEINGININNNEKKDNKNIDNENENMDNEWNEPKITFSEISKVSKVVSSEANECDNEDLYTFSYNNTNNMNILQENINIKKNLKKPKDRNLDNNLLHKKNIESKFSTDENYKTINLLSSHCSNFDFMKQTINNCLIKFGYKDIIDNSQKILNKSSSLDFLNEYSNVNQESEKIKKNLIMQMVLFTNMKNEMETLKKDNDDLIKQINIFKKEKILNDKINKEIINENNKKLNEINYLKNKIKKYKDISKKNDNIKNEFKNLIKKNEKLIKNNDKIITENKQLKEELIKLKLMKKDFFTLNEKEKNENCDNDKKDLINKLNHILKENKSLNEIIEKKNIYIKDLENNINNQKKDINNYLEKIKLLKDKLNSKTNSRNKINKIQTNEDTNNNYINTEITNEINKTNKLLFLNLYDINNSVKNSNKKNNINININQNDANINNNYKNNYSQNIDYYNNKLFEKNNIIEKLKSENFNLIQQNESKDKQIKQLLNIKSEYNTIETQNKDLKNEINELNIKYNELIDENNNNNNLIKNNLEEEINKLNIISEQKEKDISTLKIKIEKMNKKIILSYNTLLDLAKRMKKYARKEFKKNKMNLFLKGFKELIENLNNENFEENHDELKCMESICDFINLIPLEIEILYKKVHFFQKEYEKLNSVKCTGFKNDNIVYNTDINETNRNDRNMYNNHSNAYSDISLNKKLSKYNFNENSFFFKNKPIKIRKYNIEKPKNSVNYSTCKNSKNKLNIDIQNDKNKNKNLKKCNTNLYVETIKSQSDNFKLLLNKKISPFHTIQLAKDIEYNNNNNKKQGINLKKFKFNKNIESEEVNNKNKKINNDNKTDIFLKKDNIRNKNNKKIETKRKFSTSENNNNNMRSYLINKNYTNNKANISDKNENEKIDFKLLKNKLIYTGFKFGKNNRKNIAQKIWIFQNEIKSNNSVNNNGIYLKSEASICGLNNVDRNIHQTYRKKFFHKINNFSVNGKENKKIKVSFNSSISSEKKRNNSSVIN